MKFSKSILLFLFFSSLAGAFFSALDRTNGNVIKSLQFALFFLAIKIGLIGPNLLPKLDQDQPTQQLVSRVNKVELPGYHPYLSVYNDYRPSGLLMDSIERSSLVPQYSYSQDPINKLRAGDSRVREAAWLLITIWMLQQQSVGFQPVRQAPPPPHRQLFGGTSSSPRNNYFSKSSQPGASLQMERPSSIPHQDFTALTKEERRNLPDPRDGFIDLEGHPKLIARYGQVKYKTSDHGDIHGLPTNEKGKTPKTEANALSLRDSLVKMPEREGIQWFDNGGYQKGTKRGYDSVNLYDKDKRVIAIYKKQENGEYLFSTTCEVTGKEEAHLLESGGNYLTEAVLNNQKALTIINPITNKNKDDLQ
jgi:hypothetical protein